MVAMTDAEKAELDILKLATEDTGKFGLQVNYPFKSQELQNAFERGLTAPWYRLVDLASIESAPGFLFRIFHLTVEGRARLLALKRKSGEIVNH